MMFDKIVEKRQETDQYKYFTYGDDYYNSRNTEIMERKKKVYLGEELGDVSSPMVAQHTLPSGHLRKIIDQKVLYQLGNGIKFDNDTQKEILNKYFETSFDEFLIDSGLDTSKKAESWAFAFMLDGVLRFTLIPCEQLSPVYDEYGKLSIMVRTYDEFDDKGKEIETMLVYDKQGVTRYQRKKDTSKFTEVRSVGHYTEQDTFDGKPIDNPVQKGFGQVPFIPLFNNRDRHSDLFPVKHFIDVYDIINSDFANNIDDMQDAFYTLKGYSAEPKALIEFMKQLKKIKAVPISEDGDIKVNQLEIPVEARKVFLELLTKDIYSFSMAVDLRGITGGSITNVMIKAMYADLDLKCDQFESELRKYINSIIDFINKVTSQQLDKKYNFLRSMIINDNERIDGIVKLAGIISQETQRELLPYEIDMKEEDKRLEKENTGVNLGDGVVNQG